MGHERSERLGQFERIGMSDSSHIEDNSNVEESSQPTRQPTLGEKVSVLLPAVIAFGGIVLMLVIVLIIVATRN